MKLKNKRKRESNQFCAEKASFTFMISEDNPQRIRDSMCSLQESVHTSAIECF